MASPCMTVSSVLCASAPSLNGVRTRTHTSCCCSNAMRTNSMPVPPVAPSTASFIVPLVSTQRLRTHDRLRHVASWSDSGDSTQFSSHIQ